MRNLGPRMEQWLSTMGIDTAEQLRSSDPYEVYAKLKQRVPGTSLNALYALIGAIEDQDWREISRERRTEIFMRLDERGLSPR